MPSPRKSEAVLTLRIPWDRFVARGFLLSVLLHMLLFLVALHVRWYPEPPRQSEVQSIPVELLTLGWGEGDKPAGGNLSPEGQAYHAQSTRNPLADANRGRARARAAAATEPTQAIPKPAPETPTKALSTSVGGASANQGAEAGSPEGTGLGVQGTGSGRGLGIDIEWGGGGNRTVIYKVLPQYPRGHNVAGRVRLRFTVLPDGTVGLIVPLQRTDPLLERAAIEALRQWRFNPLPTATEMVGVITFTFELE